MNTESSRIKVSGIMVEVVRKEIKNLHLGVYPPNGRVRVAAPLAVSDEAVRLAVVGKLGWIKRQKEKFASQPRQSKREMVTGESHYFLGRRYRLRVEPLDAPQRVFLRGTATMVLQARPGSTCEQRERLLSHWYREQLKNLVPPLLEKWQAIIGVQAADWGIKRMKTKWGSCSISARRIWVNLELIKKPCLHLEYIVLHELLHLQESHHNEVFKSTLNIYFPKWKLVREELNNSFLRQDAW